MFFLLRSMFHKNQDLKTKQVPKIHCTSIQSTNLKLEYIENVFNAKETKIYMDKLFTDVLWRREKIIMWGKEIVTKRRIAWYADKGKSYTYSGATFHPSNWNQDLLKIKKRVESLSHVLFNSVLLNEYKNGEVGMGWHSDDEKELGKNPVIASVSFGANRDFLFKHKFDKNHDKIKVHLQTGSLLLMLGSTQHYWKHSIPKRLKVKDPRINLTFRNII